MSMQTVQGIEQRSKEKTGANRRNSIRDSTNSTTGSTTLKSNLTKSLNLGNDTLSLASVDKKIASFNW